MVEHLLSSPQKYQETYYVECPTGVGAGDVGGQTAAKWVPVFQAAGLLNQDNTGARSQRSLSTLVGNRLGTLLEKSVEIQWDDRSGTATLARRSDTKGKHYLIQIHWDVDPVGQVEPVFSTDTDSLGGPEGRAGRPTDNSPGSAEEFPWPLPAPGATRKVGNESNLSL